MTAVTSAETNLDTVDSADDLLVELLKWAPLISLLGIGVVAHSLFTMTQHDDRRYRHPSPHHKYTTIREDEKQPVVVERTRHVVYDVPESIMKTLHPNKKYITTYDPVEKRIKVKDFGDYYSRLGSEMDE